MFHLLVSSQGWPEGAGSIPSSRVYIKANNPLGNSFLNDNETLDIIKVREIPALLVTETGGSGPQFAKVAYITDIRQDSKDTRIQYTV